MFANTRLFRTHRTIRSCILSYENFLPRIFEDFVGELKANGRFDQGILVIWYASQFHSFPDVKAVEYVNRWIQEWLTADFPIPQLQKSFLLTITQYIVITIPSTLLNVIFMHMYSSSSILAMKLFEPVFLL